MKKEKENIGKKKGKDRVKKKKKDYLKKRREKKMDNSSTLTVLIYYNRSIIQNTDECMIFMSS